MSNKITLPDGTVIIDEAPVDGIYYGRINEEWLPVTEEAPNDGQTYARFKHDWVPIADVVSGLTVTEIVPAIANVGMGANLTAHVYGTGFTDTTEVLWSGLALVTAWVSANEVTVTVDPSMANAPQVDTITVRDGAVVGTGAAGFHFVSVTPVDIAFGIGLNYDELQTPPVVDLQPPNIIEWADPTKIGGINVPPRSATQGLAIEGNGLTQAPLASDVLAGTIVEPPQDNKQYARQVVDPATTPPTWTWVETTGTQYHFALGLTHDDVTGDVNLTPAGWDPTFLGGVYTNGGRSATEGLDLAATGTGQISAPLATPDLAGTIVEPPPDDKGYVRRTLANGQSSWVPPADTKTDYGTGLSYDETSTPPIVNLQPALDTAIGGIMEPVQDGMAYSRQFDAATQTWIWTPALTAGLQITGLIPNQVVFGPTEPTPLVVHGYGAEFTATTVAVFDGADVPTTIISATELTFEVNPRVPIAESTHIVTVRDTAIAAPDDAGLGAEQFKFIVPSIQVDYGTGLSFDTSTDPPIVHLDPAGPTNLGGVIVSVRDGTTQGLQIDFGDGTAANPATGELWAPPATATLLGTVKVPERTQGQGLTLEGDGGLYLRVATDQHLGGILEPSETDRPMVRVVDPTTRLGAWEEAPSGMDEPPMEPVQTWGRSSGGVRGWLPLPDGGVEAGRGLSKTDDPTTLHLEIATQNALGGVIIAPQPGLAI